MFRVTSTELQRSLAHYREIARHEPIIITDRGVDDVAMIPMHLLHKITEVLPEHELAAPPSYDRFIRIITREVKGNRQRQEALLMSRHSFEFVERLFTLVLTRDGFDFGGYRFRVEGADITLVGTSDWIRDVESEHPDLLSRWGMQFSLGARMGGALFEVWSENPKERDVAAMGYVAVLMDTSRTQRAAKWLSYVIHDSVIWMGDSGSLIDDLEVEAKALLRQNVETLRAAFPNADLDDFVKRLT